MKLTSLLFKLVCVPVLLGLTVAFTASCSDEDTLQSGEHGYVQFKLYKEDSYQKTEETSRTASNELEYLNDAKKVKVLLSNGGAVASYTLTLNAFDEENAEFGLRSEKLQLLTGSYELIGYYLYNKVEEEILAGEPAEPTLIHVEKNGLTMQDVLVKTIGRGKVRFHLVKDLSAVMPQSRTGEQKQYPLSMVATTRIQLSNVDTKETFDLGIDENGKEKRLEVSYEESFRDDFSGTSYAVVDSLCSLPAGTYKIDMVYTYPKNSNITIEVGQVKDSFTFEVKDNQDPESNIVNIPITLQESAEYIKDYVALKSIWEKMDGSNWAYTGENYVKGFNWDFNKDIDMWGNQPGVTLNNEGRVTSLVIGDFGPKGMVPDEIGQLTALQTLSLGTHNDKPSASVPNGSANEDKAFHQALLNPTTANKELIRNDYMNRYVKRDLLSELSEPLKWGLKQKGIKIQENSRQIVPFDINQGELTNGITGISSEIGKLVNLEVLYIANSKIAELPATMANLTKVTDMELYNNPLMTKFPEVLSQMPGLIQLNLAMNRQWTSEEINKGLKALCEGAAQGELQMLYLGYNNLSEIPANVTNLKKLGKIDCVHNKLTSLPAFTDINLVQASFDYNQISFIPANFCGVEDVESITFSHNKLTALPEGFFNPKSAYVMASVDFSFNEITEVPRNYGCNVSTLSLAGNKLTAFPKGLFEGGSVFTTLNLSGNQISKFEKGDIVNSANKNLETLDLTYNQLSKFPDDFNAVNVPYLYGLDISYNRFNAFPFQPLNVDRLTVLGIRYQRDADGNRCLTEWPTGVYNHKGLRGLFLGGNDIGNVNVGKEETISYLIYNLDIADNPNIVINLSEVCAYIQAGMFMLFYDSTQDIRGCDALDLE